MAGDTLSICLAFNSPSMHNHSSCQVCRQIQYDSLHGREECSKAVKKLETKTLQIWIKMYIIFFWWPCLLWVIHRCGVTGEKPRLSQRQSFIQETSLSLLQCRLHTELQGGKKAFSNSNETLHVSGTIMLNKILQIHTDRKKNLILELRGLFPFLKANQPRALQLLGCNWNICRTKHKQFPFSVQNTLFFISVSIGIKKTPTASEFLKDMCYESFSRHLSSCFYTPTQLVTPHVKKTTLPNPRHLRCKFFPRYHSQILLFFLCPISSFLTNCLALRSSIRYLLYYM